MKKSHKIVLLLVVAGVVYWSFRPLSPTKTVDEFVTKLASGDYLDSVYVDDSLNITPDIPDYDVCLNWADMNLLDDIYGFTYDLANERRDGDIAYVDLIITTINRGDRIRGFYDDYMNQSFDQMNDLEIEDWILKTYEKNTEKYTYESTNKASIRLKKYNGTWKIEDLSENKDFLNAISGGLVYAYEDVEKEYGSRLSKKI